MEITMVYFEKVGADVPPVPMPWVIVLNDGVSKALAERVAQEAAESAKKDKTLAVQKALETVGRVLYPESIKIQE